MNTRYFSDNLTLTLPSGDAGIVSTLWIMKALVDDAVESGGPTARLGTMLAATSGRVPDNQLQAIYNWLSRHITFKRDPNGLENVRHPDQLVTEIEEYGNTSGDCDDVATLGAALIRQCGLRPALIVVSVKPSGAYHHVTAAAQLPGGLSVVDPQEKMTKLPDNATRSAALLWD